MTRENDLSAPVRCCENCAWRVTIGRGEGDRICQNEESKNFQAYVDKFEECDHWEAR